MSGLGQPVDLGDAPAALRAFMKARASLDGKDTATWFGGTVHAWEPTGTHRPLFGFEGYNVARAVEVDGGFDLLSREAVFYTDLGTREVLEKWDNPATGESVRVIPVWNDPVNFPLRLDGPRPVVLSATALGDEVCFNQDIFLAYPSPLPRAEFPNSSQDDLYKAAELFQFFTPAAALGDNAVESAPARVTWTRLAPWLPWMGMGDRPGTLVYHGRGMKLAGGVAELPPHIRAAVAGKPEFLAAPTELTMPSETSWTYFKKLAAKGEVTP
jgi:hypothetical protein